MFQFADFFEKKKSNYGLWILLLFHFALESFSDNTIASIQALSSTFKKKKKMLIWFSFFCNDFIFVWCLDDWNFIRIFLLWHLCMKTCLMSQSVCEYTRESKYLEVTEFRCVLFLLPEGSQYLWHVEQFLVRLVYCASYGKSV